MIKHDLQKMVSIGDLSFGGIYFTESQVETYNTYIREINRFAEREIEPHSLTQRERDLLLDNRNKFFKICVQINSEAAG